MQRNSLFKSIAALVLISAFVAFMFHNDPLPGVRKAAIRQRREQETNKERDFRQPETETEPEESEGDSSNFQADEEGGRVFTLDLASLKDGGTGKVVIRTKPSWSPLGVAHFHELMDDHFYDLAKFFRVVPNFVVQFGIAADPKNKRPKAIKDDPVMTTNARGTLTYATSGPNTRTTQLFININPKGNAFLDKQGFSPFAEVISGMEYVDAIDDEYREKPNQGKIQSRGNEYLDAEFPNMSYIQTAYSGNQAPELDELEEGAEEEGNQ